MNTYKVTLTSEYLSQLSKIASSLIHLVTQNFKRETSTKYIEQWKELKTFIAKKNHINEGYLDIELLTEIVTFYELLFKEKGDENILIPANNMITSKIKTSDKCLKTATFHVTAIELTDNILLVPILSNSNEDIGNDSCYNEMVAVERYVSALINDELGHTEISTLMERQVAIMLWCESEEDLVSFTKSWKTIILPDLKRVNKVEYLSAEVEQIVD